jgi:hypothetical protein
MPQIYDMGTAGFTSPPKEGVLGIFFSSWKTLTSSAGFEPANLGTRSQHASSRPPKPRPWFVRCNCFCRLRHVVVKLLTVYKGPPWHSSEDLASDARVRVPANLEIQDKLHFLDPGYRNRYSDYAIGQAVRGSNLSSDKRYFFSPKCPNRLWGPKYGYRGSYPGIKQEGREAKYSLLCSAEFKNEWSYTSACLLGVGKEHFSFLYTLHHLVSIISV